MATKKEDVFESDEVRDLIGNFQKATSALRTEVGKVIIGQADVVEHLLITLLVGGHCLITGMPGTAKTLLVQTLADALGLNFKRIQFTPDLMPTDVTGTDIIEEDSATGHRSWTFVKGPIFTNVLLMRSTERHQKRRRLCLKPCRNEPLLYVVRIMCSNRHFSC
jgi:MoxR-like ATPase